MGFANLGGLLEICILTLTPAVAGRQCCRLLFSLSCSPFSFRTQQNSWRLLGFSLELDRGQCTSPCTVFAHYQSLSPEVTAY